MTDWNRPVWICLAGEQPMPNVVPVLAFGADKVVYLHTDMPGSRNAARRCADFLRRRGIRTALAEVDAYDVRAMARLVMEISLREGLENVLLNYTGGTKPMSLAAYGAMPEYVTRLYYDPRKGYMVNMEPFAAMPPHAPLGVEDFMRLNSDVKINPRAARRKRANLTEQVLLDALNVSPELVDLFTADYRKDVLKALFLHKGWKPVRAPIPRPFETEDPELADRLEEAMRGDGLLQERSGFLPNKSGLDYMNGFWWEGVVLKKIRDGLLACGIEPDDADLHKNVGVLWKGTKTDNELDILFTHQDRLFLVSCTTAWEGTRKSAGHRWKTLPTNWAGVSHGQCLPAPFPGQM